jgi:uncharacterized membrane protein YhfC
MDLQFIAHLLNPLLMIAMPLGLAIYLTRRFKLGWRVWWIGAAVFVLSQVGHIPFNALINPLFNSASVLALPVNSQIILKAVFLGLSAGLFEELFRYGMFRWWARDARSWKKGLLAGAGHGGAEAILIGILSLYTFIQLAALRDMDLSKLIPADQLALAQQQVQGFWSMGLGVSLLGALERLFTIPIQISLAVLVLQTFTRKKWYWVWLAVLYHAVIDATAVIVPTYINVLWVEAFVAFFSMVSIGLIFLLRQPEQPVPVPPEPPAMPVEFTAKPVDESKDNLDKTRYD